MITILQIDQAHKADINIPNQPFKLFGWMRPSYINAKWSYEIERFADKDISEMCFPDENYDYEELSKNSVFIGAYDNDRCIGLAILQQTWFKYMYLYDLKVNADYRGKRIGTMLIDKAKEIAVSQNYRGLFTQGQDNNLAACLFYLHNGFFIGGLDTNRYRGTAQENKKDIIFYCDADIKTLFKA